MRSFTNTMAFLRFLLGQLLSLILQPVQYKKLITAVIRKSYIWRFLRIRVAAPTHEYIKLLPGSSLSQPGARIDKSADNIVHARIVIDTLELHPRVTTARQFIVESIGYTTIGVLWPIGMIAALMAGQEC